MLVVSGLVWRVAPYSGQPRPLTDSAVQLLLINATRHWTCPFFIRICILVFFSFAFDRLRCSFAPSQGRFIRYGTICDRLLLCSAEFAHWRGLSKNHLAEALDPILAQLWPTGLEEALACSSSFQLLFFLFCDLWEAFDEVLSLSWSTASPPPLSSLPWNAA